MKKLFVTGIIYICLFVVLFGSIYKLGKEFNSRETESDETVATAEGMKDDEGVPEDKKDDDLEEEIAVEGDISENITPFHYKTTADQYLLDMCYAGLWESEDRKCISSNISYSYDKNTKNTTFRITLGDNAVNAKGERITVDDILFNCYLRADIGYTADNGISDIPIVGIQEYRYGTKNIKSVKKQISGKLKNPDKRTAALIRDNIIRPVLEKEYDWVCSLYGKEMYDYITDKYPKKKDLFVYFFAYGTQYKTKGKKIQKVINDVIKSYGTDYEKLGKITGEDYRKQAENIALYVIQSDKKFKYHTKKITGIKRISDSIVEITVKGKRKKGFINRLCNMYIVSMKAWGDESLFNGISSFGFKRGRADEIIKNKTISGDETGNYYIKEINDGTYILRYQG